jgi:hypothetical protein
MAIVHLIYESNQPWHSNYRTFTDAALLDVALFLASAS